MLPSSSQLPEINAARLTPALPSQLPPLREDLQLLEAAANPDGSPAWMIQDPVNNTFFRIGWLEFELLARWHLTDTTRLLATMRQETLLAPTEDELLALLTFLQTNQLLVIHAPGWTNQLIDMYRRARMSRLGWLLHHYLFFRIPLWHPDRWLRQMLPRVGWIYTRETLYAVIGTSLLGLVLAARDIDLFTASFAETFSPSGLTGYLVALALAKSLHELGHAFTATRYGVRVAHMGVAFLVLWPVLYTDTGESWRLKDRHQRMAIASAGILAELALAGLATLAWALTAPGDLRQAMFFLATTAWIVSLGLNASPFMRFDGYFILSDLLDLPNLHERSSALARNAMRTWLLGWNDPDPEVFPARQRRLLVGFAFATWLYRFTLFIGIAFAVYAVFFKLLGILLFLVEIGWFVLSPVANELSVWRQRQSEILLSRRRAGMVATAALALVVTIPWDITVRAEAWAHAAEAQVIYSPIPGQIEDVSSREGQIQAGDIIISLTQPDVRLRQDIAAAGESALERQLVGLAGLPEGEQHRPGLTQLRQMKKAEVTAQTAEASKLVITAAQNGWLTDLDPDAQAGVWVGSQHPLGTVISPGAWAVEAFVGERDLERIHPGDKVRFYPHDNPLFPLIGRVDTIDSSRLAQLPHPLLSSLHGGPLAVLGDRQGLVPRDSLFRVRITLADAPDRMAVRRGTALIDASARSWLIETIKSLALIVVREASF